MLKHWGRERQLAALQSCIGTAASPAALSCTHTHTHAFHSMV